MDTLLIVVIIGFVLAALVSSRGSSPQPAIFIIPGSGPQEESSGCLSVIVLFAIVLLVASLLIR
jgi:hypothetical protein